MKSSSIWLSAITVLAVVGLVLKAIQPSHPPHDTNEAASFGADLAYIFNCKGKAEPPSDQAIQKFLEDKGFRVLNKVRDAKQLHVDYDWMSMDIDGIDSARRKVSFMAFPDQQNAYFVGLYSEPPTHHSSDLEVALLTFTEKTLGCENRQVERHENPANAKNIYDVNFKTTEGWFKEDADMKRDAGIRP